jgi:hypothetical protein
MKTYRDILESNVALNEAMKLPNTNWYSKLIAKSLDTQVIGDAIAEYVDKLGLEHPTQREQAIISITSKFFGTMGKELKTKHMPNVIEWAV